MRAEDGSPIARTGQTPNDDAIEATPMRVCPEPVEFRPFLFRAGDPNVHVLPGDLPAAALAILAKLADLDHWILPIVCRAHAGVDCDSYLVVSVSVATQRHRALFRWSVSTLFLAHAFVLMLPSMDPLAAPILLTRQ